MKIHLFKIGLFVPLFLLFVGGACEKDEIEKKCACGIENPHENLEWLNIIIQNKSANGKVYSFFSENNEYIAVENWIINGLIQFYNCNGELVCEIGGAAGVNGECNMPAEYWSDFENKKELIYPLN